MVGRQSDTDAAQKGTSDILEYCKRRRPFMHIVVMFANDEPVLHYAEEVAKIFQEHGVDIFFNTDALEVLSPASKNVAGDGSPQFIRPEHLSPIILSSHADYLIVIGDKNMRKRSCQARDAGHLTEMPIDSRLSSLITEFYCGSIMPKKSKPPEDLASFTDVQLSEILSSLTGVRHRGPGVPERVEQVKQILADLEESDAAKVLASLGDSFEEHADNSIMGQLTKGQTSAVRLHQELSKMQNKLNRYPELEPILKTIQGEWVNFSHRPLDIPLERVYALPCKLRENLMNMVESAKEQVESCGDRFNQIWMHTGRQSLWQAYIESQKGDEEDEESENEQTEQISYSSIEAPEAEVDDYTNYNNQLMPGQWQCPYCTLINDREAARCCICDASKPAQLDEGEWEDTRSSRKGRRSRAKSRGQPMRNNTVEGGSGTYSTEALGGQPVNQSRDPSQEKRDNNVVKNPKLQAQSPSVTQKPKPAAGRPSGGIPPTAVWAKTGNKAPSTGKSYESLPPQPQNAAVPSRSVNQAQPRKQQQQNPTMADIIAGDQRKPSQSTGSATPGEFPALGSQRKGSGSHMNVSGGQDAPNWSSSFDTEPYNRVHDHPNTALGSDTNGYNQWNMDNQQSTPQASLMAPDSFFQQPTNSGAPAAVNVANSLLSGEANDSLLGMEPTQSIDKIPEAPLAQAFDTQEQSASVNPLVSDIPRQTKQSDAPNNQMNGGMAMGPFSFPGGNFASLGFGFGGSEETKNDTSGGLMGDVGNFALPSFMPQGLTEPTHLSQQQTYNSHGPQSGPFPSGAGSQNQGDNEVASIAPLGNLSTWSCFGEDTNSSGNPLNQWDAFNGLQ